MPAVSKDDIKQYLKEAPMLEIAELVKEIEDEFGVSAAPAMPVMVAGAGGAAPAAEEQIEFSAILTDIGAIISPFKMNLPAAAVGEIDSFFKVNTGTGNREHSSTRGNQFIPL